jgi:hypothetical protein
LTEYRSLSLDLSGSVHPSSHFGDGGPVASRSFSNPNLNPSMHIYPSAKPYSSLSLLKAEPSGSVRYLSTRDPHPVYSDRITAKSSRSVHAPCARWDVYGSDPPFEPVLLGKETPHALAC